MKKILIILLVVISLVSCATKKEIIYFQDLEQLDGADIEKPFVPLIEPNDILNITLSAMDDTAILPFRKSVESQSNAVAGSAALQGFLVNSDGFISYPGIGDISVAGKSRMEVVEKIKLELKEYVTADVVVDVRIVNFKITVLGEVEKPGVFTVVNERITLPEALALAGDLTEDGNRNEVNVIREVDGKRKVATINLTSTELFSSPFYYLKQNDFVYVEPSLRGVKKSGFIPDIPALISLASVILSTVIILTR